MYAPIVQLTQACGHWLARQAGAAQHRVSFRTSPGICRAVRGALPLVDAPVAVTGLTDVVQVSAGDHHACAVRADGTVVCWSDRGNGRLGDGGSVAGNEVSPVTVSGLTDALAVTAGNWHSCAGTQSGAVWCWDYNALGMIGDDSLTQRVAPAQTLGLP